MAKARILLIENQGVIALDIEQRLSALGYEVIASVSDSEEGLRIADAKQPDLVIMNLQSQSGSKCVESARYFGKHLGIPVIFLTASSDHETLLAVRDAGPYGFLLKPFEDRDLLAAIETALIRHQWEQQLWRREQHLSTTLKSIGDAVIATNSEGKVTFMNPVAEKLTGWKLESAARKPVSEVFIVASPDDGSLVECPSFRALKAGKVVDATHLILLAAGDARHDVDVTATPIADEKGIIGGSVLLFRDVRKRVEMEKILIQAKEKYLSLINGMNDGFVVTDELGTITFANRALAETLNAERPEALLGRQLEEFLDVRRQTEERKSLLDVLKRPEFYDILEFTVSIQPEARTRIVELKPSPIIADGRLLGIQALVRDITSRRLAEEELAKYRQHLEELVMKRTQQLAESNERLRKSEKMESVGLLAGGVAHDLNNIIGPLMGYAELMLLKLPDDDPNRTSLEKILRSAEKAASVLQDVLTLARRGRYEFEPIDLNRVVQLYSESKSYKGIAEQYPEVEVSFELDKGMPNIRGCSQHLPKAVTYLIANALKSTCGGGKVVVSTSCTALTKLSDGYEIDSPGDYICLKVFNTGPGISQQDLKRVFEPYYSARSIQHGGSGLELAVVYGIIKDHNGYYDIQSAENEGTDFRVYIPVMLEEERGEAQTVWIPGRGESILVIDDVSDQREMTIEMLTRLGYKVTAVGSGKAAIEYMRDNTVDLLILDMILDEALDGCDIYAEIIKTHPGQKAVIVSGYSETDRVRRAQALGAGPYIRKPFSIKAIARAVSTALQRKTRTRDAGCQRRDSESQRVG